MGPPSVGGSGGAFTAPTPGSAAAPSAPAAPSASAPPADVAKPTPARPAVAGGVAPLGTQDPAAAAALHAARQFFGFMHQGMAAGGFGAAAYALSCPEAAGPFVAIWYSLGMVAAGVVGALLGPWALRW